MQGDDHVGQCMGNKPETTCYEEGNKGQFQNLSRKKFEKANILKVKLFDYMNPMIT